MRTTVTTAQEHKLEVEGVQNPYATVGNTTQTRRLAYVSVRGQAKQPYATLRRDYADPKFCFFS